MEWKLRDGCPIGLCSKITICFLYLREWSSLGAAFLLHRSDFFHILKLNLYHALLSSSITKYLSMSYLFLYCSLHKNLSSRLWLISLMLVPSKFSLLCFPYFSGKQLQFDRLPLHKFQNPNINLLQTLLVLPAFSHTLCTRVSAP